MLKHGKYLEVNDSSNAAALAAILIGFMDEVFPDWAKKIVGYAGDGGTVNGVQSKSGTAVTENPKHTNVATILQRTLQDRGVNRKLLTSWCGAHRNSLVWKDAWKKTSILQTLERVMKKAPPYSHATDPNPGIVSSPHPPHPPPPPSGPWCAHLRPGTPSPRRPGRSTIT